MLNIQRAFLLLDDVKPGDFIMLHAGFAIEKVDPEEAAETAASYLIWKRTVQAESDYEIC